MLVALAVESVEPYSNAKHASIQVFVILDTPPSMLNTMPAVRVYDTILLNSFRPYI